MSREFVPAVVSFILKQVAFGIHSGGSPPTTLTSILAGLWRHAKHAAANVLILWIDETTALTI